VKNRDLLELITTRHEAIVAAFDDSDFVELGMRMLTLHPRRS